METTAENDPESVQTVEIIKQPGQTLGFYIREGNGVDRTNGVFISRIASGSVVAKNALLRVSDEILSVNSVDVTHMSLDDVVILMSIAKRLVLTVRFQKPQTLNAIISGGKEQENHERRQQPVVVLKSGFANSFSGVEDRSPDEFVWGDATGGRYESQFRVPSRDQSVGSYFMSKWSSCHGNSEPVSGGHSNTVYHDSLNGSYHNSAAGSEYENSEVILVGKTSHSNEMVYGSPRTQPRHLDYASDTDVTYHPNQTPFEQVMSRCNPYTDGSLNQGYFSGHPSRAYNNARDAGALTVFNGTMPNEQYSSDSEIITNYPRNSKGGRLNLRNSNGRMGAQKLECGEMFHSLPHRNRDDHKEFQPGIFYPSREVSKHGGYSGYQKNTGSYVDMCSEFGNPNEITPTRKTKHVANMSSMNDCAGWLNKAPASGVYITNFSRSPNFGLHRLTRKMSTDSLLDCKTYQMDDTPSAHREYSHSESPRMRKDFYSTDLQQHFPENPKSGLYTPLSTMTLSRVQHGMRKSQQLNTLMSAMSLSSSEDQRSKGNQLGRMPLKIQTETFQACQSSSSEGSTIDSSLPGYSGLLYIHIFCAHGLKLSRTTLRDLYCVTEVNEINMARTMIRTGAINFDWDEEFEIDIKDARRLSFLVYSWDPHTRHTLCFSSVLSLMTTLEYGKYQRLAVKLEPKGTLYVELNYTESATTLLRRPSLHRNAVFGVDLKTLIHRENPGLGIPLVIIRCITEIERRGLDHVGLYRLCGSARRKIQLREEFERNVCDADLSVRTVSDVNVITSVLKDFLRELPEPLCSNALYQMLLDALSVQVPGDHEGNTQLMLEIVACLPRVNQETLAYVLNHLKRVSLKSDVNKMTTLNLAISLGPALICPSTDRDLIASSPPQTMNFNKQIELLKYLLDIWTDHSNILKNPGGPGNLAVASQSSGRKKASKSSSTVAALHKRSISESNGGRLLGQQKELQDPISWEMAETSSC